MSGTNDEREPDELDLLGGRFGRENPYELLELDRDAEPARVRAALRSILKRAAPGDENAARAQAAADQLLDPRRRLAIDLFTVRESRLFDEIVRRYADAQLELVPEDVVTEMMRASDLEWGDPVDEFEVPQVPKVCFESMMPAPARDDELVVPDRKK